MACCECLFPFLIGTLLDIGIIRVLQKIAFLMTFLCVRTSGSLLLGLVSYSFLSFFLLFLLLLFVF